MHLSFGGATIHPITRQPLLTLPTDDGRWGAGSPLSPSPSPSRTANQADEETETQRGKPQARGWSPLSAPPPPQRSCLGTCGCRGLPHVSRKQGTLTPTSPGEGLPGMTHSHFTGQEEAQSGSARGLSKL